jgi:hypothetical protein
MRKCVLMLRASDQKLAATSPDQPWCSSTIFLQSTSGILPEFHTTRHSESVLHRAQLLSWVKMDSCSWWTWYSSLSGVSSQFSASSLTSLDQTSSANCQSQALKWTIIRLLNSKQKAPSCLMGYRTFASYSLCRRCCTKHQVEIWKKVLQKRIVIWKCCWKNNKMLLKSDDICWNLKVLWKTIAIWKCCWKQQQNTAEIWSNLLKFDGFNENEATGGGKGVLVEEGQFCLFLMSWEGYLYYFINYEGVWTFHRCINLSI